MGEYLKQISQISHVTAVSRLIPHICGLGGLGSIGKRYVSYRRRSCTGASSPDPTTQASKGPNIDQCKV